MEWWISGLAFAWVIGANRLLYCWARHTAAAAGPQSPQAPADEPPHWARGYDSPTRQTAELIRAGNRIGAIYLLLETTGLNFREAQAAIAVVDGVSSAHAATPHHAQV